MLRKLRLMGDPVLVSEAQPVEEVTASTKALIEDMLETMDSAGGVGLAANQVGVLQRVFVYDCPVNDEDPDPNREYKRGAIVNPVWEAIGDEKQLGQEGCLSIPDVYADTERYQFVRVTGFDEMAIRWTLKQRACSPAASNTKRITWTVCCLSSA